MGKRREIYRDNAERIDSRKFEAMIRAMGCGYRENGWDHGKMKWWRSFDRRVPGRGMGPHAQVKIVVPPRKFIPAHRWHSMLAHEMVHAAGVFLGSLDTPGTNEERIAELGAELLCSAFTLPYPDWYRDAYETLDWTDAEMYEVKRRIEYILTFDATTAEFGVCPIKTWTWPQSVHVYGMMTYPSEIQRRAVVVVDKNKLPTLREFLRAANG